MLPGDVLLKPGSHVMLFLNFAGEEREQVEIIDASRRRGKVALRSVVLAELMQTNYLPCRA